MRLMAGVLGKEYRFSITIRVILNYPNCYAGLIFLLESSAVSEVLHVWTHLWLIAIFYRMSAAPCTSCRHSSIVFRPPSNRLNPFLLYPLWPIAIFCSASGCSFLVLCCCDLPLFPKTLCTEPATFCFAKLMALGLFVVYCWYCSLSWLVLTVLSIYPLV